MSDAPTHMTPPAKRKLDLVTKLTFGFGSLGVGVKDYGFKVLLLLYYNQVIGLPAAKVSFGIMIAMIMDGMMDPVVGQISDNWRSRWGRRHPFMYFAALPSSIAFGALWLPPTGWSEEALVVYMIVAATAVRSFITFYEVPSVALVPELTSSYDERTSMMSYRYYFFFTGQVLLAVLTFRIFLQPDAEFPVGQLNPHGYQRFALTAAPFMLFAMLVACIGTHKHIPYLHKAPATRGGLIKTFKEIYETLFHGSFLTLTVAGLCKSMSIGISGALNLYLYTYYWQLTSNQVSILLLDGIISALAAATLSKPLSRRFGKKGVCMVFYMGAFIVGVAPLMLRHFGLFWPNGSPYLVPTLFVQGTIFSALGISSTILAQSMIADVVEDSQRKTGRRSEGLFFSAGSLMTKAISGTGVFGAGIILAIVAFPQDARPGEIGFETLDRLAMTYIPISATIYTIGLIFMSQYRINRDRHEANLAALGSPEETATKLDYP
jgi:Na+/melibiose symporter-like transporter